MKKGSPIRVLIAEDDVLVQKEMALFLKGSGFDVVDTVSSGLKAVEKVRDQKPDVVIMDVEMPGINGIEAARRITADTPVPIVVLTAHSSIELVRQASDTGVMAYLIKPYHPDEIERAITLALARHEDMMELRRLNEELERKKNALEKAMTEIKTLRGILPICSRCKKIRDDEGYWSQLEDYVAKNSDAEFSHSLCPNCYHQVIDEIDDMYEQKKDKDTGQ